MGDRSQIAIKMPTTKDADAKIYLYGHWSGAGIYGTLRTVIARGQRLNDPEYLTRIIFREMGAGQDGETGFGIGNEPHADTEHLIPVLDCDARMISFEIPAWKHNRRAEPEPVSFKDFLELDDSVLKNW